MPTNPERTRHRATVAAIAAIENEWHAATGQAQVFAAEAQITIVNIDPFDNGMADRQVVIGTEFDQGKAFIAS